jgi:hypothetical protein
VSSALFPGASGATFPAHVAWDAGAQLLTLVVTSPSATYELSFQP